MVIELISSGITIVLGGLVGFVCAHFQSTSHFKREQMVEKEKLKRTKLEEAYVAVEEVKQYFLWTAGEAATKKLSAGRDCDSQPRKLDFTKAKMLIAVYAKDENVSMGSLEASWVQYNKLQFDAGEANREQKMLALSADIGKQCDDIQSRLVEMVRFY